MTELRFACNALGGCGACAPHVPAPRVRQGESLLNDGSAIVAYQILVQIVRGSFEGGVLDIILLTCRICGMSLWRRRGGGHWGALGGGGGGAGDTGRGARGDRPAAAGSHGFGQCPRFERLSTAFDTAEPGGPVSHR